MRPFKRRSLVGLLSAARRVFLGRARARRSLPGQRGHEIAGIRGAVPWRYRPVGSEHRQRAGHSAFVGSGCPSSTGSRCRRPASVTARFTVPGLNSGGGASSAPSLCTSAIEPGGQRPWTHRVGRIAALDGLSRQRADRSGSQIGSLAGVRNRRRCAAWARMIALTRCFRGPFRGNQGCSSSCRVSSPAPSINDPITGASRWARGRGILRPRGPVERQPVPPGVAKSRGPRGASRKSGEPVRAPSLGAQISPGSAARWP